MSRIFFVVFFFVIGIVSQGAAQLTLLGHLDKKHGTSSGVSYSGCWGYVAPNGREYALLGTITGTAIIDITNPDSLREIVHITGPTSIWREMRTYKERAYVVSEGGNGVQIINLEQLPDTATLVLNFNYSQGTKNITRNHTIEIFDGYMYLNGSANWSPGGVLIFSLANPDLPVFVGMYQQAYAHDSYVRGNRLYSAAIYNPGGLNIADITNKTNPTHVTKITYSGAGTHNAWTTADGNYVLTTDEIGSTPKTLKIWDVSSIPPAPASPIATYTINPADIVHNVTVRGNYAYVAWYTAGIVVVDIENPAAPSTAGWYDTSTESPGTYNGVWGVYPYFWSGKVIAGDMQNGLYVFSFAQLAPRQIVQLQEPPDSSVVCGSDPIPFRWTRAADPTDDPHQYWLTIQGPSLDTTYNVSSDSTFMLNTMELLSGGTYQWWVTITDEATEVTAPDTFTFDYVARSLTLLSPTGGEIWFSGTTHTISWKEQFVDSIAIDYSTDNGATWTTIISDTPAVIGSYEWTVPDETTMTARIRIRDLDCSRNDKQSALPFSILPHPYINVEASWNLLSIPVVPTTKAVALNFPDAVSPAFMYAGNYAQYDSIDHGKGFWIRYPVTTMLNVPGELLFNDTIDIDQRWNIIGSLSVPVEVASIQTLPETNYLSEFYSYSLATGYVASDTLYPGRGYWVKASENGQIILNSSLSEKNSRKKVAQLKEMTVLTFEENNGNKRILYLTNQPIGANEKMLFELPPPPPRGVFDVRFSSHSKAEYASVESEPLHIIVRDAKSPIVISLQEKQGETFHYKLTEPNSGKTFILNSGERITCSIPSSGELLLEVSSEKNLPQTFELHQNYPNPFNPVTEIKYQTSEAGFVTLKVYNMLGEEITTLVRETKPAGHYSVKFNADALPSGVYYYRMTSGTFTQTKKLVVTK